MRPRAARGGSLSDTWSDAVFREALQLIADGVAEAVGFEVAAISLVREDGMLEFAAIAADEPVRRELLGSVVPADAVVAQLERATEWGHFRFVPHHLLDLPPEHIAFEADGGHPADRSGRDEADAAPEAGGWHPRDLLAAPIHDDRGVLRGLLQVDVPVDRRRPGPARQQKLQRYAAQARRAVLTAVEREEAERRLRLAADARRVLRDATSHLGTRAVLEAAAPALLVAFGASRLCLESLVDPSSAQAARDGDPRPCERLRSTCRSLAARLWEGDRVLVARRDDLSSEHLTAEDREQVAHALDRSGAASLMVVALGVGDGCEGYLALTRTDDDPWTAAERETALDLATDLGRALLTARLFAREREVAAELRDLDEFRRTFVRVLAHELKNPLAAVSGHAAVLADRSGDPGTLASVDAIGQAAGRMRVVIDDLLVLAGLDDASLPLAVVDVDLAKVAQAVVEANQVVAARRGLTLGYAGPEASGAAVVRGDAHELERGLGNLVGNALTYTPAGGRVDVRVDVGAGPDPDGPGEVRVAVTDDGPGIAEDERARVFDDFYRGTAAAGREVPGSGLGLPIVALVAERHGGAVELDTSPGAGSTFTLVLPAPR